MISYNRHSEKWEATCDRCSMGFDETEADNFSQAVQLFKQLGWSIYKDEKGQWVHSCVSCGLR